MCEKNLTAKKKGSVFFNMTNNSIKKEEKQDFLKFNNKKKKKNLKLADVIKDKVGETTLTAIQNCSYFMKFYANVTLEKRKLMMANSCNNRFCPMCAYRKARKDGLKHMIMMKKLKIDKKYSFIFLTLTAPSVTGENLRKEVIDYAAAFQKLAKLKEFQNMNVGYIRKLEITYNSKKDTYHPHYHVLICVDKSYFRGKKYIKHNRWLKMWREAKQDDNITNVHVAKVKDSDEENVYTEISKYTAKDSDYLNEKSKKKKLRESEQEKQKEIFGFFYDSLKGRQVITYNKIFKDLAKKYDTGELDYLKEIDETKYVYRVIYKWYKDHYEELEITELTDEEINDMNNLIDGIDIENMEE